MNFDSNKIYSFYVLAMEHSFTKAAQKMGLSQPALSKKIRSLEDNLELSLIIRSGKSFQITEEGKKILRYYEVKKDLDLDLKSKLYTEGRTDIFSELKISIYHSVYRSVLLPCLKPLFKSYQSLKLNIQVRELRLLEEDLISGKSRFIISDREIIREGVKNNLIGEEENIHIVPKLKKYPDVFFDHDPEDKTTLSFFKKQNKNFTSARSFLGDIDSILEAVNLGYGQAIVSSHLAAQYPKIKAQRSKKRLKSPIYLSYFESSYYSQMHKDFIQILKTDWMKVMSG